MTLNESAVQHYKIVIFRCNDNIKTEQHCIYITRKLHELNEMIEP